MAVEDFPLVQKRGKTIYMIIRDLSNDTVWDSNDNTFKALAGATAPFLAMTETSVFGTLRSTYLSRVELVDVHNESLRPFYVTAHIQKGTAPDPVVDQPAGYRSIQIDDGLIAVATADVAAGVGVVRVDQNYGGPNRLCAISDGVLVDNAEVLFYLSSDFLAGRRANKFIVAASRTQADGSWVSAVMLDPAEYVLQFHKQGEFGPNAFLLLVTEDPSQSTVEPI